MATVNMDSSKLEAMIWASQDLDRYVENRAQEINKAAAAVFTAEEKKGNEWRTSETTPPKYLASFKTRKNRLAQGRYSWLAINDDPAALWVEVGAHAGGKTLVLKYRPFGRALDLVRVR